MERRDFVAAVTAGVSGTALSATPGWRPGSVGRRRPTADRPMVGIQVGAVSFVDEGTDRVLDGLEKLAAINTLFVATFTYGRGIAGRQLRGQPLPDHGRQEYDDAFRGGNFATPHPQFYRRTTIAPEKAPDHAAYDVLADVLPAARRRRMRLYCWFEDVFRQDIPGFDQAAEIDLHGKRTGLACHRNPNTRNFWLGLAEDYLRSYDVDGLMWGSERQGPLDNALSASHGGGGSGVACFCPHCLDAARQTGIDTDRAREGYLALERWAAALRAGQRPADGAFVTFWRLLVKYPELLAWERLWNEGLNDTYRDLYRLAKSIAPDKGIGWHIWHNNSFSPFYRAEQDYKEFRDYSDFLKVVMYNNCGGPRLASYIDSVSHSIFADLSPDATLDLIYKDLNYKESKLRDLPHSGLSADYVDRETRRAFAGAGPRLKIWPGIDIDIPTGASEKKTQPEDVYQAVRAAFQGGAPGVLLSRKYSEMQLANIRAAGRAVRERQPA